MSTTALKSPEAAARWLRSWVTGTLVTDSRKVRPGDAFIAWPGQAVDGRRFVKAALDAGATTCVVEREGLEAHGFDDARIASLPGLKAAAGVIADAFFDHPSAALDMLAVTGTNGKSSTAWWCAQALTLLGRRCGVVGTLGIGEPPLPGRESRIEFTGLTTPDPVRLHGELARFVKDGFSACSIEASSIGIEEQRLAGLRIAVAIFTNFTRDHLDYHGTMATYWAAKRKLFDWPGLRCAAINVDDEQGAALARELSANTPLDVWTVSTSRADARLVAREIGYTDGGLSFTLHEGDAVADVRSTLIGEYNVHNLLGMLAALRALGVPLAAAASAVPALSAVPGRMQPVGDGHGAPQVVVDYAHTPDALDKVLAALRPLAAARGGQLVCVFGCGGNRDATKRPLMGEIAARLADRVIVTSDNPRDEDPKAIIDAIVAGARKPVTAIDDRRAAIAQAVMQAQAADVIVLAGKGHEDYQETAGVRHPFSDLAEATQALMQRGAR